MEIDLSINNTKVDSNVATNDESRVKNEAAATTINIFEATNDSVSCEENEADATIHGFNLSSINNTVIEKVETPSDCKNNSCEGSDSGVEVIENVESTLERAVSTNSQEFETATSAQSCDSSIISCCSNYDEAYNLLVRRNSSLLDDYKLRNVDGTSENGSESSSVASTKISKRSTSVGAKKKVILENKRAAASTTTPNRSRIKPPLTPKPPKEVASRAKSIERPIPKTPKPNIKTRTRPVPDNISISNKKEVKSKITRTPSNTRTPITTPTDDGRWPSSYSKPAPLMTRSLRGILPLEVGKHRNQTEVKNTLEKYATLPRRRKERSADNISDLQEKPKPKSRDNSATRVSLLKKQSSREGTPSKTLPPYPKKKPAKTRIYHEISVQTALNLTDIENALAGIKFSPKNPDKVEKVTKEIQVEFENKKVLNLEEQLSVLKEKYEKLKAEHEEKEKRLRISEQKVEEEKLEKEGLREELKNNNERVAAMLGCDNSNNADESATSDSLMVLETRFENVSQVIIKQEEEISKLNAFCRALQRDFDKSLACQKVLMQQQKELESESIELQEFMQIEKSTLSEAMKELESEVKKHKVLLSQKEKELEMKNDEFKQLTKMNDQRRKENLSLQARFANLESQCRELLVHQGSTVSGAAVALSALVSRLEGLVDELVNSYNISEQELDDVIFHNEAYSNSSSSPDATPDKSKFIIEKSPSPKRGSSFIAAVINAIRNATTQSPFIAHRENSRDNITDNSDSTELLDSETEPCLMMEPVLEDVIIPDGHSHNMISSGHSMISSLRLTHSESLNNLSHNRQKCDQTYRDAETPLSDLCPSVSLVDQVIDVDNLVTRLLKVIRIIQMENEDFINDLQDERDSYCGQVNTQRETNKVVVKQLKDWEILGAKLKSEVKELFAQLNRKNEELDDAKNDLNQQRKEVEKLNGDVCELSTALSQSELAIKMKEEDTIESIKKWEKDGEIVSNNALGKLIKSHNESLFLNEKLQEKDKQLSELTQEYIANKQVLSESLREAVNEAKRQYEAIDNALESLHSIQPVVQQCPTLVKLQQHLEEISFQSASAMPLAVPPDCNANAALLQAMASLQMTTPINTSA